MKFLLGSADRSHSELDKVTDRPVSVSCYSVVLLTFLIVILVLLCKLSLHKLTSLISCDNSAVLDEKPAQSVRQHLSITTCVIDLSCPAVLSCNGSQSDATKLDYIYLTLTRSLVYPTSHLLYSVFSFPCISHSSGFELSKCEIRTLGMCRLAP